MERLKQIAAMFKDMYFDAVYCRDPFAQLALVVSIVGAIGIGWAVYYLITLLV